ncbi:MAG: putative cytokinetic ring protein SteA, partial [Gaiellales bacterium]
MNDVSPRIKPTARVRVPRFRGLRRERGDGEAAATGVARLDGKTKKLTKRLEPGDIAIIDHVDLDRVSAEALAACGVAAVINVARSISGRYPNLGPQILVEAGVPLIDDVGPDVFTKVHEGDLVRVDGEALLAADHVVAKGIRQTEETVEEAMIEARAELPAQLEAFAANTMEFLKRERDLLLDGVGVPDVTTDLDGRHVLIVVRGYHYREDIATLRPYIREYRPVLIGVDGGADALIEAGYRPDMIVGDMDSVSDEALTSGAELVVHAFPDGRAPGRERLDKLGLKYKLVPAPATSEDVAMLIASEKGAELIVTVGSHFNL